MKNVFQKKVKLLSKKQESILSIFSKAQVDLENHLINQHKLEAEINDHIIEQQTLLSDLGTELSKGHNALSNIKKFLGEN